LVYTFIMIFLINANVNQCMATNWADDRNRQKFIPSNPHEIHIPMTDPWCCYIWCAMDPMGYELCMEYIPWVPSIYHRRYHDWGILLLYMVCHGYYQYTPVMLAYIPAPCIRHGILPDSQDPHGRCVWKPNVCGQYFLEHGKRTNEYLNKYTKCTQMLQICANNSLVTSEIDCISRNSDPMQSDHPWIKNTPARLD
jgi:hypothetical protein